MSKNTKTPSGDPFSQRESANYERPIASREHLLELISTQQVPVPLDFLAETLGYVEEPELEALRRRLQAMVRDGQVFRNRRGGYLGFDHMDLARGYVQTHPDGFGFLRPETGGKDIFMPARQMRTLMNGDRIAVKVTQYDRQRGQSEGALIAVLERAHETLVGRYHRESGIEFVVPDDKRLVQDVLLKREIGHKARPGDIVLVRITDYPSQHSQSIGVIERVLGEENAPGMEVTIAVNTHHIPHRWSEEVENAISNYSERVDEADKLGRRDLRKLAFVTIDGADARDFDDAVYCETLEQGYRLYVAIADVAHYVAPDSALDHAAQERGTSVYFPGEVIPMLPEILSNGLCSLKPDVDRLCVVCEMDVNERGTIGKRPIAGVVDDLHRLRQVYGALAKARRRRHAIEFETREVVFRYDSERKIEAILPYRRNQAHMLIEECMIAANICAARQLKQKKLPTLYRIHEGVNVDKLPNLQEFLASFGIALGDDNPTPADFARIVEQARGRPESDMIQTVVLRSLLQASYSPNGKFGHFGLALKDYAHFTSPIRRYPDLLVHRALKHWIHHGSREGFGYDFARMTELGESCSRYERRADDATRDAADWLKCEFLQKHIGRRYYGIVSAVTSFGLFVQLDDLLIDGLVHVTALKRDYYQFDPAHHRLVGEQSGRQYRLGDRLEVEVARVDMEERKIDFDLVAALDDKSAGKTRRKGKKDKQGKGGKRGKTGKRR